MDDTTDLSGLLGSRICHDLISPLGAISNGVELLLMSGAAATPEVALIAESVASANARIRFFRVAFGSAGADQRMGRPEILSILTDLTKGGRLTFDWAVPGDVPRPEVKLAFLILQCCETALPYGGRVSFNRTTAGRWRVQAQAAKLKLDADLWAGLKQPPSAAVIGSAHVHFALLAAEAARQSRPLSIETSSSDIVIEH